MDVARNTSSDLRQRVDVCVCTRVHVQFSYAAQFSWLSFPHSFSFLQMESHIRKHKIHIMLISLIYQLNGSNFHFKTSFIAELIESLLCLAPCHVMRMQWQYQDPAPLQELTVQWTQGVDT